MGWVWYLARVGDSRGAYWVFVGKPEGKRQLRRPTRRWDENLEMLMKQDRRV
jgi:hypothetical protein